MPLIDRKAAEIADPQGLTLYPAADLPASLSGPSGVILSPDADLALLAPHLPALAVVAITFPKFRTGAASPSPGHCASITAMPAISAPPGISCRNSSAS
ncbi:hypothetical protein GT370_09485 [Acidocella sp. MX-AZ03]|uniref:hypothetical protein n=1 Tax=Acidocella sp. MX-AZ03 TaxID=2697363 RepID=UPI0022DD45EA|nr:hypothetical protein [Acidocella sp. MX-AZ03]WBO60927.1 hypothetical protein GT370_09485 [Acidocella sp. MX-AZ03]